MARATRKQFEDVHLNPWDCDDCVELDAIWYVCAYHSGYLDGFEEGREESTQTSGPPTTILVTPGTPEPNL